MPSAPLVMAGTLHLMEPDDARDRLAEAICLFRDEIRPATREALIHTAVQALVAGVDSPALAELAGRYPDDPWSVLGQATDAVVHELDLAVPEPDDVNVVRLRWQLEELLAGTLTPRELAAWAHSELGHNGIAAAQPFVVADDEYDSIEYSSWTNDELDAWIRHKALAILRPAEAGAAATVSR